MHVTRIALVSYKYLSSLKGTDRFVSRNQVDGGQFQPSGADSPSQGSFGCPVTNMTPKRSRLLRFSMESFIVWHCEECLEWFQCVSCGALDVVL